MVNLYMYISQSHKRTLEAAINAASTKFRSGSLSIPLLDLQSHVQEALDLKVLLWSVWMILVSTKQMMKSIS